MINPKDITYRKHLEAELIHCASHDTLTGLPNRPYIVKRLEQILGDQAASPPPPLAVIFIYEFNHPAIRYPTRLFTENKLQ